MSIQYPTTKGAQVAQTFGYSSNLPGVTGSIYTVPVEDGFAGIAFNLSTPGIATCSIEGTFDLVNWFGTALRSTKTTGTYFSGVTNGSDNLYGSIAGMQSVRVRTTTTGAGSGTIIGTVHRFPYGTF